VKVLTDYATPKILAVFQDTQPLSQEAIKGISRSAYEIFSLTVQLDIGIIYKAVRVKDPSQDRDMKFIANSHIQTV